MNRHRDHAVQADLHLLWPFWTGLCWDVYYFALIQVNGQRHMKGRSAKQQFNCIIWAVNHFHMGCMHAHDRPTIRFNILRPVCVHCELLVWPLAWGYYPLSCRPPWFFPKCLWTEVRADSIAFTPSLITDCLGLKHGIHTCWTWQRISGFEKHACTLIKAVHIHTATLGICL